MTEGVRSRSAWGRWVVAGVAAVFAVVVLAMAWYRADPAVSATDFRDFWENADHFRRTGRIAADLGVHNYLPVFTILMTPWSLLPVQPAAVLFVALSLAAFAWTVRVAAVGTCAGGGARAGPAATLLAVVLMSPYVYACAVLGNLGLLLAFCCVAARRRLERGQEAAAGVLLGAGVLLKLLPAVLVVYLVLTRRWRAALWAGAVVLVVGAGLPLLALGPRECLRQHIAYWDRAVVGHSAMQALTSERPAKANFSNIATAMVLRRLLSPVDASKEDGPPLFVNLTTAAPAVRLAVFGVLLAAIAAASVAAALTGGRGASRAEPDRWAYESWTCLALLTSPLVWTHYLPLAHGPLAMVSARALGGARGAAVARAALVLWGVGLASLAWPAARAAGGPLLAAAALWLACAWCAIAARPPRPRAATAAGDPVQK